MKKKIFIGSIIAVVILVLVSFTSVVGYRSEESNMKASPLFNIRTSKAIDKDIKNTLTTNYIGKENKVVIPFLIPTRATISQNVIQRIKEIDDKIFEKLLAFLIQQTNNSDDLPPAILQALYIIKEETDEAAHQENAKLDTVLCETLYCQTVRCNTVFAGCTIHRIFTVLIRILDGLYVYTEKFPIFKGTFIHLLHDILLRFYDPVISLFCPLQ